MLGGPEEGVKVEPHGDHQRENGGPFRESEQERHRVGNGPVTSAGRPYGCVPEGGEPGDRVGFAYHTEQGYGGYKESEEG